MPEYSNLFQPKDRMYEYASEMQIELQGIFTESNFSMEVEYEQKHIYVDGGDCDLFTMYASSYKRFRVYYNEGAVLEMYLLDEESRGYIWYIAFASFSDFKGKKYGTRVVGAVSKNSCKNLRISDRSDVDGVSIWKIIVEKFPELNYQEV